MENILFYSSVKDFALHQNFTSKLHICDMKISSVYLEPISDIKWFMIIPRINNIKNILDLNTAQRSILWQEIDILSNIIKDLYNPDQLNIAMLGNVTPQLHCHVIARFKDDKAWPDAVFGRKDFSPISNDQSNDIIHQISQEVKSYI